METEMHYHIHKIQTPPIYTETNQPNTHPHALIYFRTVHRSIPQSPN